MRTKVFIMIDAEFSIGGAVVDPLDKSPIGAQNVLCEVNGRSEGLGFMLETFRAHDIRATFFTEVLQTAFFGDRPMSEPVQSIAAAGHDLQLHPHPVWTYFDHPNWQQHLVAQLAGWMQRGIDTFARWGLPASARPAARNDV